MDISVEEKCEPGKAVKVIDMPGRYAMAVALRRMPDGKIHYIRGKVMCVRKIDWDCIWSAEVYSCDEIDALVILRQYNTMNGGFYRTYQILKGRDDPELRKIMEEVARMWSEILGPVPILRRLRELGIVGVPLADP